MMKCTLPLLMALMVCGVLSSCSKQGPAGATGAQGPAGPTGGSGAKGDAGTANVIYSGWIYASKFRDTSIDESNMNIATLSAPSLTKTDLDSATILVYFTFGEGIFPLPYTSDAGGLSSIISFIPSVGSITITRYTIDNSNSVGLSSGLQYRFVIIPGGVSVPDSWDYANVSKFYHISI
jgi:hypothetical protein